MIDDVADDKGKFYGHNDEIYNCTKNGLTAKEDII